MEENVALDTTKQRKFVKSIKGIKKLIKKHDTEPAEEVQTPKIKTPKPKTKKKPDRGLVYLSHIPHGFYEHEMSQYFKQFGVVTNVRVIRSKRTGNSKGFAFVEFREPAVAEIVAETMNNYLMGKRLIKAAYVPPEKQRPKAMRKHWSRLNNPGIDARLKYKKSYNENKDEEGELKKARKTLSKLNKTKKELSGLGINYDFFTPVDVPEALQNSLITDDTKKIKDVVKDEKKQKKAEKEHAVVNNDANISVKKSKKNKEKENEKNIKAQKDDLKKEVVVKNENKQTNIKKEKKINKEVEPVINKKEQKKKQQKLTDAGMMHPPEKFIKVTEDPVDSDSSFEFDSDEYEKMLENDGSDDDSTEYSDNDEDESEEIESEEENVEDILPPVKKNKAKPVPVIAQPQKQNNKQKRKAPALVEKSAPKKPPVAPKKAKFEKQSQKSMKKQFKKKK